MIWAEYGYVIASKYRTAVVKALLDCPRTPKQISERSGISIAHTSRTLKELLQKELVTCVNPQASKGRVYKLTEKGMQIACILDKGAISF